MHHVILRDDDTNALTPVECLEQLYRPFLERGFPVNLAVIPKVRTNTVQANGNLEGFLIERKRATIETAPIAGNTPLVRYLLENKSYHVAQHGYHHSRNEFDSSHSEDIRHRLEEGTQLLLEAGFAKPQTFVAPYDKLSRESFLEIARRFRLISTGWFELRRLPLAWWSAYFRKKIRRARHWRVNSTFLLSHPGCLLSYHKPYECMLKEVRRAVESQPLTVLVTHWWEYFRDHRPDEPFIQVLHEVADYLAGHPQIQVVSFDDVAEGRVPLP